MITSRHNAHVKEIRGLQKKEERFKSSLFIVEGKREISRVNPDDIVRLYVSDKRAFPGFSGELIQMAPELIEDLTYRGGDAIALVKMKAQTLEGASLIVCGDRIEKPGNLGAMMRTADGAGFDAVVSIGDGVDLYSPNVIRASLGAFFTKKVCQMETQQLIDYCKRHQITLFAASPEASRSLYEIKFPPKVCIVIGSEAHGISQELKNASTLISLPMLGVIDSLNAASAFGIIAYEIVRQRNFV